MPPIFAPAVPGGERLGGLDSAGRSTPLDSAPEVFTMGQRRAFVSSALAVLVCPQLSEAP